MAGESGDGGGWEVLAERRGVRLRARGSGTPVFIFSGLEGSGESCLHLVLPTIERAGGGGGDRYRAILVDYAAEQHATFEALVETCRELVAEVALPARGCRVWCQSFGNLLGCSTVNAARLPVERFVLVSPFTTLPGWKLRLAPPVLAVTPDFLYRWTIKPLSRWQFGPDGGNTAHPFFGSLAQLTRPILRRRVAWLRGRSFEPLFRSLTAPRKVWLGSRDRLVDLRAQRRFFDGLAAERTGLEVELITGSGHVVLPPPVIDVARQRLAEWFWSPGKSPGKEVEREALVDAAV
jgi:hypothetical protein